MSGDYRHLDILPSSSSAGPSRPSPSLSAGLVGGGASSWSEVGVKKEEGEEEEDGGVQVDTSAWREEVEGLVRGRKRKWAVMGYESTHMADLESTFLGYQMALTEDQLVVTHPPPRPFAFTSVEDAVERLLPYHVFQVHEDELEGQPLEQKKAEERDRIETAEAGRLKDRVNKVHERFFELRRREGTHPSHLPSLIQLLRSSTHQVRQELIDVQNKYRQAQNTLSELQGERLARERKEAAAQAANAAFAAKVRAQQGQKVQTPTASPAGRPGVTPSRSQPSAKAATPVAAPTPKPTPATKTAASTPATAPRPRGRPPKVRENGLRETVLKGGPSSSSAPSTPKAPTNGTASTPSLVPSSSSSPGPIKATTPAQDAAKGPVTINIATTLVPYFTTLGIIAAQPDPSKSPPGKIVRTTPDKKTTTISIELFKCTQPQLNGLAKVLGIKAAQGASVNGSGNASGTAK